MTCSWGCTGLAGLQAAIFRPDLVRGVQLMNISLRLLHLKKQPAWKKPVVKALQAALHSSFVGPLFFGLLAKPKVRSLAFGSPGLTSHWLVLAGACVAAIHLMISSSRSARWHLRSL